MAFGWGGQENLDFASLCDRTPDMAGVYVRSKVGSWDLMPEVSKSVDDTNALCTFLST